MSNSCEPLAQRTFTAESRSFEGNFNWARHFGHISVIYDIHLIRVDFYSYPSLEIEVLVDHTSSVLVSSKSTVFEGIKFNSQSVHL
jgi:hypothetical protein